MASKFSMASFKRMLWHVSFFVAAAAILAAGGMLWYSGNEDGKSAMGDGRRLTIQLSNGKIEGKQLKIPLPGEEEPETEKEAKTPKEEESVAKPVELKPAPDAQKTDDEKKEEPKAETAEEKKPAEEKTVQEGPEEPKAPVAQDKKPAEEKTVQEGPEEPKAPVAQDKKPGVVDQPVETKEAPKGENAAASDAEKAAPAEEKSDEKKVTAPEVPVDKPPAEVTPEPAHAPVTEEGKPAAAEEKPADKPADGASNTKAEKPSADIVGAVVPSVSAVRGVNDALTEKSKDGALPKIASDGTKPWKYYSKSAEYKGDYPVIAIIVTGLGTSKGATESAIKLPENITLSFSPYARNVESWATAARVTGHEVMLDLPLQPADYPASDPGPYGLLTSATPEANEKKLQWLLSRFGAFVGVLTPLNDGFINDSAALAGLYDAISKRGLVMTLSRDVVKSEARRLLEEAESPVLVADVILDEDLNETAINSRIATLQQRAREHGYAVGIAQSYPITLKLLSALPERFSKEGFTLMPATYVAKQRFK